MSEAEGWIAVARGMLDHPLVGVRPRTPFSQSEAWQWLLFEAAWKPRRYSAGGIVVELQRGQLAHSTRYMSKAWRWPETNVRRFLERLKTGAGTGAMIGAESGAGITVITICNYERYQTREDESGAESGAPNGAGSGAKVAHDRRRKEQLNNSKKDITRSRAGEIGGFASWYSIYPRKKKPKDAERAFGKLLKAGEIPLADLMARTRTFAATWAARPKTERQFCPYPASWLNSGEYLDTPEEPAALNGGGFKIEAATPRDPATFTESDWQTRVPIFEKSGRWPASWGPPPGAPGCLVPPALLTVSR